MLRVYSMDEISVRGQLRQQSRQIFINRAQLATS